MFLTIIILAIGIPPAPRSYIQKLWMRAEAAYPG
jgi:hypothetical protein